MSLPINIKAIVKDSIVAVEAEGGAEKAVINILLDSGNFFFSRNQIFDREVLSVRKGSKLEDKLQGFDYGGQKIVVLRILDSDEEKYIPGKWGKKNLVDSNGNLQVFDILTRPEIEMLYIHAEKAFDRYQRFFRSRSGKKNPGKPSTFCKEELFKGKRNKYRKSSSFAEAYFHSPEILVDAIHQYHQKKGDKNELDLSHLLKADSSID